MTHENLMVTINLTKVRELQEKAPDKFYKTANGETLLTIYCDTRRSAGQNGQTHNLHVGKVGDYTFYVGSAKPSKYQPDGGNSQQSQSTNSSTTSGIDMPW